MGFVSVLAFAQQLIKSRVHPTDTVVDATLGTGNDALFLAGLLGKRGRLFGFDIQKEAIDSTNERFLAAAKRGEQFKASMVFFHDSHAHWLERLPADTHKRLAAVMFNLGFLPGGSSPKVITQTETTLTALRAGVTNLRTGGILTAVIYPGHPGGDDEASAVNLWSKQLSQDTFDVIRYQFSNRTSQAPYLIAVERRK